MKEKETKIIEKEKKLTELQAEIFETTITEELEVTEKKKKMDLIEKFKGEPHYLNQEKAEKKAEIEIQFHSAILNSLLKKLKDEFPKSKLTMIISSISKNLIQMIDFIDEFIISDNSLRTINNINSKNFDLILNFSPLKGKPYKFFLKAKRKVNIIYSSRYKKKQDFIQKYIFPGGFLPSKNSINKYVSDNDLSIKSYDSYADHYPSTLTLWRNEFNKKWDKIKNHGFDLTFKRMWEFYLCYCEAGFKSKNIDLIQFSIQNK